MSVQLTVDYSFCYTMYFNVDHNSVGWGGGGGGH